MRLLGHIGQVRTRSVMVKALHCWPY